MFLNELPQEQQNFIVAMNSQIDGLCQNFEEAASVSSSDRWAWSDSRLTHVFRDGWFVNTPVGKMGDAESVSDHKDHLVDLIGRYYPSYLQGTLIAYALSHDNQEAIAHALIDGIRRDLNPKFNTASYAITGDDKTRIEEIAIGLLCENDPASLETWRAYKNKKGQAGNEFAGLDSLCVMWKCVEFVESGKYQYPDFQAYWDYWSIDTVQKKGIPPITAKAYREDLYPRIQKLQHG